MSFASGFGRSLAASFRGRAEAEREAEKDKTKRQRDREEFEQRAQWLAQFNAAAEKTKAVGVQFMDEGGQLIAQPVNALGEPVGSPRVASSAERTKWQQQEEDRNLDREAKQEAIKSTRALTAGREVDTKNSGKLLEAELGYKGAMTRNVSLDADTKKAILDQFTQTGVMPGRSGSASMDQSEDSKRVTEVLGAVQKAVENIATQTDIPPEAMKAIDARVQRALAMPTAKEQIEALNQILAGLGLGTISGGGDHLNSAAVDSQYLPDEAAYRARGSAGQGGIAEILANAAGGNTYGR